MKVRTGMPVSLATIPPSLARLPTRARGGGRRGKPWDVIVVGAGITGALVAHELVRAGWSVLVVDKRQPGRGSTAASTGLLLYAPDMPMAEIARRHGMRAAQRVYRLGRSAIRDLRRLVRRLAIDCRWRVRRSLYVASRAAHVPRLRLEAENRRRAHLPVAWIEGERMRRICAAFPAAVAGSGVAEVDALRLTVGVLRDCARSHGFALRTPTRVRRIDDSGQGVIVTTDDGALQARYVVVATGYEIRRFLLHRRVRLQATFVIASPRMPGRTLRRLPYLMWETARPYFYLRTTADRRILFGGLDEPYAGPSRVQRKLRMKTRMLERTFARLFPDLAFEAEFAWAGAFADTTDGLPIIGPRRRGSHVLYALGYGGNGITFSQIAANVLRDHIAGRRNPDERLFGFSRKMKPRKGKRRKAKGGTLNTE